MSGAPQQPQGLSQGPGWPLLWLCVPFPGMQLGVHVAISVPHVWALVQLWVSLQLLSVAALKIE